MELEFRIVHFADKVRYYSVNGLANSVVKSTGQKSLTEKQVVELSKEFEICVGVDESGEKIYLKGASHERGNCC